MLSQLDLFLAGSCNRVVVVVVGNFEVHDRLIARFDNSEKAFGEFVIV
jgi:hypothetical protein